MTRTKPRISRMASASMLALTLAAPVALSPEEQEAVDRAMAQ